MKLPPEIRNRIYQFALGGKTIHVNLRKDEKWLYICQASTSEDEAFEQYHEHKTAPPYSVQHMKCEQVMKSHFLGFSLLKAYRSVYNTLTGYFYQHEKCEPS